MVAVLWTGFALADPDPDAGLVRLIEGGAEGTREPAGPAQARTVSRFDIEVPGRGARRTPPVPVPNGALWPDAQGRIEAPEPEQGRANLPRNPWIPRATASRVPEAFTLECRAVILPADADPVAELNGRIVRRGDSVGPFDVALVSAAAVVVSRRTVLYVVPVGRRVTVALEGR